MSPCAPPHFDEDIGILVEPYDRQRHRNRASKAGPNSGARLDFRATCLTARPLRWTLVSQNARRIYRCLRVPMSLGVESTKYLRLLSTVAVHNMHEKSSTRDRLKAVHCISILIFCATSAFCLATGRLLLSYPGQNGHWVYITAGQIVAGYNPEVSEGEQALARWQEGTVFFWWFDWGSFRGTWFVAVPIWILCMLMLLPSAVYYVRQCRRRKRYRAHQCIACGYQLNSTSSTFRCPECGRQVAPNSDAPPKSSSTPVSSCGDGVSETR